MTPYQKGIYKNPRKALDWSLKNHRRFLEVEPSLAILSDSLPMRKDPEWAYMYASVIGGRWPEAEPYIAKDLEWAYKYARNVIKGRWPEAEPYMAQAKDPYWAYEYARNVIRGRWPEAEETIAKSEYKDNYLKEWPEAKDDWAMNGWIDWLDT